MKLTVVKVLAELITTRLYALVPRAMNCVEVNAWTLMNV